MLFTTSWDDGHPDDLRLADMLASHGFVGTFYVPLTNIEGLPVMNAAELRHLADAGMEIGSHTLDHVYANRVPLADWTRQVNDGRQALEQALGRPVPGFCYPGGKIVRGAPSVVQGAGFGYARTTENLRLDAGEDRFLIPTTLQICRHDRLTMTRNYVRHRRFGMRRQAYFSTLRHPELQARLRGLLHEAQRNDGVFHLWGHSWELEAQDLWGELDAFLRYAAGCVARSDRIINARLLVASNTEPGAGT